MVKRILLINEPIHNSRCSVVARAFIIEKSPNPYKEHSKIVKEFEVRIDYPPVTKHYFKENKPKYEKD